MRIASSIVISTLVSIGLTFARADEIPCQGRGSVIAFVNGVRNTPNMASVKLEGLKMRTAAALTEIRGLSYELAMVDGTSQLLQLAQLAHQRQLDDFQRFWIWVENLEALPDWFEAKVRDQYFDAEKLSHLPMPEMTEHLELYSRHLMEGKDVVIVSHSAGNYYANAALRELPDYVPRALQPTLRTRHANSPLYPAAEDLVANVQIGTPVRETVWGSPWVNFKNDWVLRILRPLLGSLPGNIQDSGVDATDSKGHGLIEAYLANDESYAKIIEHIVAAHRRLKYPIPFFEDAGGIRYDRVTGDDASPDLFASIWQEGKELTTTAEKVAASGTRSVWTTARCMDLRAGSAELRAETVWTSPRKKGPVSVLAFVGGDSHPIRRQALALHPENSTDRWILGRIQVGTGKGKNPIGAKVEFFTERAAR